MSKLEITVLIVAVANVVFVIEFVRRRKLQEGFALLWLAVGVGGVLFALFRSSVDRIARAIGVSYGANLVLAGGILFLLFVSMGLSLQVSRLQSRTEVLAEEIAFLRGTREPLDVTDE
jgi:hypothetical protein